MLPASFFAIAAIALCPILNHAGIIGNVAGNLGFFAGVVYLVVRCGMVLEERLTEMERKPGRRPVGRSRATKARRTGRALVTR
jgi:hypothetical protein